MKRLAIFVSGGGTDFQSIIDGVNGKTIHAEIVLCVASKQGIYAIERAKQHNIPYKVFNKSDYACVAEMFDEIASLLDRLEVDLIVLAGYLTILPQPFVAKYKGKIINIHPSLIPKYCGDGYYGIAVHRAVIEAGEPESGATVHYVDEGVDTGNIIRQEKVPVYPEDTPETLAARVLALEHKLLPEVVKQLCANQKNTNGSRLEFPKIEIERRKERT